MANKKKDDALMIAARFLTAGYYGKTLTRQDMKLMADLCWLALPIKYRMSKDELDKVRTCDDSVAACGRETNHAEHKESGFCRCTHAMYDRGA